MVRAVVESVTIACCAHHEVLESEAVTAPQQGPDCTLIGGEWYSPYDDTDFTAARALDNDHFVPPARGRGEAARQYRLRPRSADTRVMVPARLGLKRPGEISYYLAYAPVGTLVEKLVRVAGSRWAIEECFQAAKGQCGLDEYEVRRYPGWHRHITLAVLAHAFLAPRPRPRSKGGRQKRHSQPGPAHRGWGPSLPAGPRP